MTKSKINLKSKLESIKDYWSPKVIAELNDYQFKLAKIKDEFIKNNNPKQFAKRK